MLCGEIVTTMDCGESVFFLSPNDKVTDMKSLTAFLEKNIPKHRKNFGTRKGENFNLKVFLTRRIIIGF
jgi:hypothetical protein